MEPSPLLRSTQTISSSSLYTTTSSSTHWGPGAMAGKAILAMGKAVVRGAEYLVISRRLSSMKAIIPTSDDVLSQLNFEGIFDDLLELSRPALYPEAFRVQAMQLLITQIATRQTYYLRCSISNWEIDHQELVAFLSEIIEVVLFSKRGFPEKRLVHAYTTALPLDCHPWSPCINFMSRVAELSDSMRSAVLQVRFLEAIIWVSGAQRRGTNSDSMLELECSEAFSILSKPPSPDFAEQILQLCSNQSANLLGLVDSITVDRMWPVVEGRLLEMHAGAMLEMIQQSISESSRRAPIAMLDYNSLSIDAWESAAGFYYLQPMHHSKVLTSASFMRNVFESEAMTINYTSKHSKSASSANLMRNFLRCVGIGGDVHNQTVDYLARLSYRKKVKTLTRMIQYLIAQSLLNPSTVESSVVLFMPGDPDIPKNIVKFLVRVSASLQSVENPLLDAALSNILPFVATCWDSASIFEDVYRRFYSSFRLRHRSPLPYRTHSIQLLNTIRSSDLSAVIDEAHRSGSWVHFLQPLFQTSIAALGS
ncbi:hypothetical protein MVEN_01968100 [Mycena venus]|uniref:Uncharacterized protein n=1 Tax=Mycena venus TaxID=2733690 RepID=A0A8H6XG13_9AGAR|nr:hypothetical protein MVEN_01968100 [Mycena venus]